MSNFKFRLYLDTRYKNNNPELLGKYQVKIRVTALATGRIKLIKTNIWLEEGIFHGLFPHYAPKKIRSKKVFIDSMNTINSKEDYKILKRDIENELRIWENSDQSHIRTIDQLLDNKGYSPDSILLSEWRDAYLKLNRSKSSNNRKMSSYKSFDNFWKSLGKKAELTVFDITPDFLNDYEIYMLDKGNPIKTISGYAKDIRTILKMARDSQSCSYSQAQYPFVKYSTSESEPYIIKEDESPVKSNITKEELEKFESYVPETELEQIAKDVWMFSFLSGGMNIKDIYTLKQHQLNEDGSGFWYYRKKTKRLKVQQQKPVYFDEENQMIDIIERHKGRRDFVFSFHKNYRTHTTLKDQIWDQLKKIAAKLNIESNLNFMSARHAFFSTINEKGYTAEQIQELTKSHTKPKQTKRYITRLNEADKQKELFRKLRKK